MNEWSTTILLSIAGGYLYRKGGTSSGTLWRDLGIPSCMAAYFLITGHLHWILIFCFMLMFAAQTSYFKKKGTDAKLFNWILVGLAFSLALLPYSLTIGNIPGFLFRACVVSIFIPVWSMAIGKDFIEEWGRGWIQIITLPLLLIGG